MSSGVSVFPDKEMNCYQVESFIGTPCALKKQETLGETVSFGVDKFGAEQGCVKEALKLEEEEKEEVQKNTERKLFLERSLQGHKGPEVVIPDLSNSEMLRANVKCVCVGFSKSLLLSVFCAL